MSLKDNIKRIRKLRGLSVEELASKLGVNRRSVYDWEEDGVIPRETKIHKIAQALDVSIPDLYSDAEPQNHTHVKESKEANIKGFKIPFYDTIAVGGYAMIADQEPVLQPLEYVDPGDFFRKASGVITVYGHSNFPKYPAGCKVAFRDADKSLIFWGEDYVIETSERRIIKRLEKHEDRNFVKAVSYNKSEEYVYADIEIPIEKIKRLYMVLGKIELEASI